MEATGNVRLDGTVLDGVDASSPLHAPASSTAHAAKIPTAPRRFRPAIWGSFTNDGNKILLTQLQLSELCRRVRVLVTNTHTALQTSYSWMTSAGCSPSVLESSGPYGHTPPRLAVTTQPSTRRHPHTLLLATLCVVASTACAADGTASTTTTTTVPATTTTTPTTTTTTSTTTTTTEVVVVEAQVAPARKLPPLTTPVTKVGRKSGNTTKIAQQRLLDLGFWLAAADGTYDTSTTQAVMAFQKYYGLATDGMIGPKTAEALNTVDALPAPTATAGTLIEVDKTKQLVFVVVDGRALWVLNTSTGTEVPYRKPDQKRPGEYQTGTSVTRPGLFAVTRQRSEGWWDGDLGRIYRPKYFDGGIALHGSRSVPQYPASHGCVRLSLQAMDWVWESDIVPLGTPVWVHGEIPKRTR